MNSPFHTTKIEQVLKDLKTDGERGLHEAEVEQRLAHYGENRLEEKAGISPWTILVNQFKNIIVILLLVAVAISLFLQDYVEAVAIAIVIILNALFGFFTEYRAEKAMDALNKMVISTAKVVRDGSLTEINALGLVPGDIILVEEGDQVTADARLILADNLAAVEASLTGEAHSVDKKPTCLDEENIPIGDRINMLYMGTTIVRGNGRAVVTATGSNTEIGEVSSLLKESNQENTPLEKRLSALGRSLAFISIGIAIVVAVVGIGLGRPVVEILRTSIALAIAAVPEGLPAVATITLAIGMTRMAQHNAIIRRLPAVETLGSTTVICTDKTGTLTENQMTVEEIWLGTSLIRVTGSGYQPEGDFHLENGDRLETGNLDWFLKAAALASNAAVHLNQEGRWDVVGDPTEGALVVAAMKKGFDPQEARLKDYRELREIPFSSEEKRMAVYYQMPEGRFVITKGSPDIILASCNHLRVNGKLEPLNDQNKKDMVKTNNEMAARGLRVLAIAYRPVNSADEEAYHDLIFLGLAGIMDPPRKKAATAIQEAARAGIRTIMITGDQPQTARSIGERLGLDYGTTIHEQQLQAMTRMELAEEISQISIFARVSPRDKLNIVDTLQEKGEIVAMTGDGVNDAPALKQADIGIAMGIEGTVVAREAADMVLADDNFATIIRAVKEGRVIFDNIYKFIQYLFSCNLSEILVIFISLLISVPLPLVALQILWLNLVTDVFPALSLGWEPAEENVMQRPPRPPGEEILTRHFKLLILFQGLILAAVTLAAYLYTLKFTNNLGTARTVAFLTLALVQLFHIFNVRNNGILRINRSLFSNLYIWGAIILVIGLQAIAVYIPLMNRVLQTTPPGSLELLIVLLAGILSIIVIQLFNRIWSAIKTI